MAPYLSERSVSILVVEVDRNGARPRLGRDFAPGDQVTIRFRGLGDRDGLLTDGGVQRKIFRAVLARESDVSNVGDLVHDERVLGRVGLDLDRGITCRVCCK